MILAAGFGERARPLSLVRPKPLFPVLNRPSIEYALDLLIRAGVTDAAVNAHHLSDLLSGFLADRDNLPRIRVFREDRILGTGGGVGHAASFLGGGPFFLINSDIIAGIDLAAVAADHDDHGALVTLVLHDFPLFNQVAVDTGGFIAGFRENPAGSNLRRLAFTGIHVIEPEVLSAIPDGPGDIITVYQSLIRSGAKIRAYVARDLPWWDIGTLDSYLKANGDLALGAPDGPILAAPDVEIAGNAIIEGWACLGEGAVVEAGAYLKNVVLWPNSRVTAGTRMVDSVAADGAVVSGHVTGRAVLSAGHLAGWKSAGAAG